MYSLHKVMFTSVLWLVLEAVCEGLRQKVEFLHNTWGAAFRRLIYLEPRPWLTRSVWSRVPLVGTLPHLYELSCRWWQLVGGAWPPAEASCGYGVVKFALALVGALLVAWAIGSLFSKRDVVEEEEDEDDFLQAMWNIFCRTLVAYLVSDACKMSSSRKRLVLMAWYCSSACLRLVRNVIQWRRRLVSRASFVTSVLVSRLQGLFQVGDTELSAELSPELSTRLQYRMFGGCHSADDKKPKKKKTLCQKIRAVLRGFCRWVEKVIFAIILTIFLILLIIPIAVIGLVFVPLFALGYIVSPVTGIFTALVTVLLILCVFVVAVVLFPLFFIVSLLFQHLYPADQPTCTTEGRPAQLSTSSVATC
nr:uncharacterized protein LOC123771893 [Procambarus clarkii]XP_045620619.1 uncharacterized protein LOC123771893 [Procambarus clarkii]